MSLPKKTLATILLFSLFSISPGSSHAGGVDGGTFDISTGLAMIKQSTGDIADAIKRLENAPRALTDHLDEIRGLIAKENIKTTPDETGKATVVLDGKKVEVERYVGYKNGLHFYRGWFKIFADKPICKSSTLQACEETRLHAITIVLKEISHKVWGTDEEGGNIMAEWLYKVLFEDSQTKPPIKIRLSPAFTENEGASLKGENLAQLLRSLSTKDLAINARSKLHKISGGKYINWIDVNLFLRPELLESKESGQVFKLNSVKLEPFYLNKSSQADENYQNASERACKVLKNIVFQSLIQGQSRVKIQKAECREKQNYLWQLNIELLIRP